MIMKSGPYVNGPMPPAEETVVGAVYPGPTANPQPANLPKQKVFSALADDEIGKFLQFCVIPGGALVATTRGVFVYRPTPNRLERVDFGVIQEEIVDGGR